MPQLGADELTGSTCPDGQLPGDEACNGLDDDCDGRFDEDFEDAFNACGGCGALPVEACDGRDNNCDGQVDELSFGNSSTRALGRVQTGYNGLGPIIASKSGGRPFGADGYGSD